MRRRFVTWLDSLLIGMLLGLIFIRFVHASPLHQRGEVHANGITIAYETYGPGDRETILLIAGTAMQLIDWDPKFCEDLVDRGYRVVVFDNRDAGLSTKFEPAGKPDFAATYKAAISGQPSPLPYTLYDMAKDAVGLMDALHISKAHVVGASMGGMIAQIIATNYPERVLSLTSMMAPDGKPGLPLVAKPDRMAAIPQPRPNEDRASYIERRLKTMEALESPTNATPEEDLRRIVTCEADRSYCPVCDDRQAAASLFTTLEDRRTKLKNVHVPVIAIHGADDPLVPVEASRDLTAIVPNARLLVLPGMGHNMPSSLMKTIADAIADNAARAHTHESRQK
jgi:pimeloyl-ACP methyl ester carboxylesterase